jgi:isopenicillin-N N-acyltransferase-like protein
MEIAELGEPSFACGKALGALRGARIRAYLSDWFESLRKAGVGDARTYIRTFLQDTNFVSAIKEWAPDLLEEVNGLAAGSDVPIEVALASQFMDEEWAYRAGFLNRAEHTEKCSSIAVRLGGDRTLIGQNMDLGAFTSGHQVLLRLGVSPCAPGSLIFSVGAIIGLLGVNSDRVGVCVNAMPDLPARHEGLPVAFVIRKLLQSVSASRAVAVLSEVPHATAQHYLIADPFEIRSFEVWPGGTVEVHAPTEGFVAHTNHAIASGFPSAVLKPRHRNSVARLDALHRHLRAAPPDLSALKRALCSCDDANHPVCRRIGEKSIDGNTTFTTGSMISCLDQETSIESLVSAGPPSLDSYISVELRATGPS